MECFLDQLFILSTHPFNCVLYVRPGGIGLFLSLLFVTFHLLNPIFARWEWGSLFHFLNPIIAW